MDTKNFNFPNSEPLSERVISAQRNASIAITRSRLV